MRRRLLVAGLLLALHGAPVASVAPVHPHPVSRTASWPTRELLVTAYAKNCCQCDFKVTASETIPSKGTVAVDTSVFPFGTEFVIPGYGYGIARDTGGAVIGNHIDIVQSNCTLAVNWGPRHLRVKYHLPM